MHHDDIKAAIESGELKIKNFDIERLGTASYDVRLGTLFGIPKLTSFFVSSAEDQDPHMFFIEVPNNNPDKLKDDKMYKGVGIYWVIARFIFTLRHFFLVGVDKYGYFFRIPPYGFILGELEDYFTLPRNMEVILDGKSAGGRWGLLIHATAGYVDIGFNGLMTLEIKNLVHWFIKIYPGRRIGQLRMNGFDSEPSLCYGDEGLTCHYQGDDRVKCSKGLKI